jgi:hypothetical protein
MIIHDSDRALKRLWYAKKKLAVIKMHDLPAKATLYEGFTIKVWQQDELEGGFIKSPMGLVIMHMGENGLTSMVADFWMGGINHRAPMNALCTNPTDQAVNIGKFARADLSAYLDPEQGGTWEILPFKLIPTGTAKMTGYSTVDLSTVYQDLWARPVVFSYLGEAYWAGMAGSWFFYDPDGDGNPLTPTLVEKDLTEILLNFYSADGSQSTRTGCLVEAGDQLNAHPARIHPGLPQITKEEEETVVIDGVPTVIEVENTYQRFGHMHTVAYDRDSSDNANIGGWFEARPEKVSYYEWKVSTIVQGVPNATLRSLMNDHAIPHGNYQFALPGDVDDSPVQQLHCMDAYKHIGLPESAFTSFYSSNPSLYPYNLTIFKWAQDGAVYTFPSSSFISLLDGLADNPIDLGGGNYDYEVAYYMLGQLFPYPNNNYKCPFDSVMFHSHSGNVYTWTRKYGTVQFSNAGLAAYTIYLPDLVTLNDGVRPDISVAGSQNYTLVATKPGKLNDSFLDSDWVGVKGVFVGTPFAVDSWTQLPDPPTGFRLRYVRPVNLTERDVLGHPEDGAPIGVTFIGVAEQYQILPGETSLPTYPFRACFINYVYNEDTYVWEGSWQMMTAIPIETIDWLDQFSVGLFGDGSLVDDLKDHICPPSISANTPVQPYDKYAAGMP